MEESNEVIVRRSVPNKFDHHPRGTFCKVIRGNDQLDIYVQRSKDSENPHWDLICSLD